MRCVIFFLAIFLSNYISAQQQPMGDPGSGMRRNGLVTINTGFNVIDNALRSSGTGVFGMFDNWNVFPFLSSLGVDVHFKDKFAYSANMTMSLLYKDNLHQYYEIKDDLIYFSIDANMKYYFYSANKKEMYAFLGPSLIVADETLAGMNFGLGGDIWLSPRAAIRLQTTGKFHTDRYVMGKTHAVHSVGFVYAL